MEIQHHARKHQFSSTESGLNSVLDYELDGGQMVITHTLVPTALRGRGIAAELVKSALAHARSHNLKVVPDCSYVAAYMDRHKEYDDLRVEVDES